MEHLQKTQSPPKPIPSAQPSCHRHHQHPSPFHTPPSVQNRRLPRPKIPLHIPLPLNFPPGQRQRHHLDGHKHNGQIQTGIALAAQRIPVRGLGHGDVLPAAGPRGEGVDCLGGVDDVVEDDGDQGACEAEEGGEEGYGGVGCCAGAELGNKRVLVWFGLAERKGETYSADLAKGQGDDVGDEDDGAADDEGDGRADVELVGPERQHEVGRDVGFLVDAEGVGRDAEHGQAHQQRQRRGAHAGAVDDAEGAHLGLEVEVLGVALDGRGRALGTAVGAAALLHVLYRVFFV